MSSLSQRISKADYLRYLECPRFAWLWKQRPELRIDCINSRLSDQGDAVEKIAHELFPKGVSVNVSGNLSNQHTLSVMETKETVIYQATAITSAFIAKADILIKDDLGWHLYEVKSSTKIKPEHIADIGFQASVFTDCGITLNSLNIILVDTTYIFQKNKGIEPNKFLYTKNISEKVYDDLLDIQEKMKKAHKDLNRKSPPNVPSLKKSFKYDLPKTLEKCYRQHVPEYSIYDISNIRKPKLDEFCKKGIIKICDVPDRSFKSNAMNLQVSLTKEKSSKVNISSIREQLDALEYPLYFLDYEAINPAIPLFDKTHPYDQIPFQYSLHKIPKPGARLQHTEFLHADKTNPIPTLVKQLTHDIGQTGTIIVWNQSFEKRCNRYMGKMYPRYKSQLESINLRVFDLMGIFKEKYIDYRFKGSCSIKSILPVLIPELSYSELDIQHGGMAIDGILDIVENKVIDRPKLITGLKEYCKLDTMAMVRIFEFLNDL